MEDTRRRRLLWYGFLLMMIALLLGFPTQFAPHARAWMAAHVTAFISSLLVLAVAHVWGDLELSEGQRRTAFTGVLLGTYGNLAANVFASIVDLAGPATRPGVSPPHWQIAVFAVFAIVFVPGLLTAVGLVLHGLRAPRRA